MLTSWERRLSATNPIICSDAVSGFCRSMMVPTTCSGTAARVCTISNRQALVVIVTASERSISTMDICKSRVGCFILEAASPHPPLPRQDSWGLSAFDLPLYLSKCTYT